MISEPIEPRSDFDVEDSYPLTPMQAGILFHVLKEERPGPYIEQFVFEADRVPDPDRLAAAWTDVIQRHPALRTVFVWEGVAEPVQVVVRRCAVRAENKDLTGLVPERVDDELQAFLASDRTRGIALSTAPLMRLTTLAHDRGCFVVWTLHHLVMDGWSLPISISEVAARYRSTGGDVAPPPTEPRPFREYVSWLSRNRTPEAEAYWRESLAGMHPTPLCLRTPGLAAERAGSARTGRAYLDLTPELSVALAAAARQARVTLSTLFQAAWAVLIARHVDMKEAVFGLAVSGRPPELAGVEHMVGVFINTVPRRILVDDAARLSAWLREVQRGYLDTLPYQNVGLPEIQRVVGLPDGVPLFDTIVVFENYPGENPDFDLGDGLSLKIREVVEDAGYPLTLTVLPRQPSFRLQLLHDQARFSDEMATTLLGRYQAILKALTRSLDTEVGRLDTLSEAVRTDIAGMRNAPIGLASLVPDGLLPAELAECDTHVLDTALRLVPAGVVGTIHVGQPGWLAAAGPDKAGTHTDTGLRGYRSDSGVLQLTTEPQRADDEEDLAVQADGATVTASQELFERSAARIMRDLWTQILGRPVTDPETDFFRAGGDSLAAVRLVGKIRAIFAAPVPVNALFEDRSLMNLLHRIDAHLGGPEITDDIAAKHV